MPIPASTISTVRFSGMQVVQPVFNYWPADVVATGTITGTPTAYPIGQVSVSWASGFSDVEVGQLWVIRSGESIVSYGVVRLAPTSSILYIDGKSRGDPGLSVSQIFGITAGHQLTVYSIRPLWSLLSRIVDGEFFKKFDVPYTDEGSNPAPVVNIGKWRQAWADPTTLEAEFFFTNDSSFAWGDKTLSSYLWELPSGATLVTGTTTSDEITVSVPEGFHIIKCTVTDSGGASTTAIRPIWVNGDNFPPLSEQYAFEIGGDSQDRKGRTQSLTFVGQLDDEEFLPGFPLHYSEIATFNGQEITPSSLLINNFAGFSAEEIRIHDLITGEKATSFEVFGPWQWMEMIPMVSQAIVETDAPAAWTDVARGLGIPQFMIWYVLKHHSTFLDMFDYDPFFETDAFTGDDDNPRKLNWGLNGSTLAEYVNQVANTIGGNAGCKSDGTLALRRDPSIESTDYRNTVDERMTLTIDEDTGIMDFAEPLEVTKRFHNEIGQLRVFTLSYNGTDTTAFGSIAPGYTQMQAPGQQDEDSYIVKPEQGRATNALGYRPGGQLRTNQLSGHLLAKANNPTPEISGALVRNMDFFDPAEMAWVRLNVPANWSPRGEAINTRTLPTSVDRSWEEAEGGAFVKVITLSVEPETFGQPGETYNIDTGGGEIYTPEIPPIGIDLPEPDETIKEVGVLFAITEDGNIGRSKDGENWENIRGNVIHDGDAVNGSIKFNDLAFDVFTEYPQSGFVEGALGAWVAVAKEFSIGSGVHRIVQVYYTEDCLAQNVVWDLQWETDNGGSNSDGSMRIRASVETEGYAAMAYGSDNGVFVARTTDGTSWFNTVSGDAVGDNSLNGAEAEIDFNFHGSRIICSGWSIADSKWLLTRTTSQVSSFGFVPNSPESDIPWPLIEKHIDDSTVYATRVIQETIVDTQTYLASVSEENPQTFLNTTGSNVPVVTETLTGTLTDLQWGVTIRGDPLNGLGFDDPEPDLVAGYHDSDRVNPETSICGPGTFQEYAYDDGWLYNDDFFNPPIQDDPDTVVKVLIAVGIRGNFSWDDGLAFGYFTFDDVSLGFPCIALTGLIRSRFAAFETFDDFGLLTNQIGGNSRLDADGWVNTASGNPPAAGLGGSSVFDPSPESTQDIRYVIFRGNTACKDDDGNQLCLMPMCATFGFSVYDVTVKEPTLYAIDFITGGAPSYNDITPFEFGDPDDTYVPTNPYSFAIDAANDSSIVSVMERTGFGGGHYIAESFSSGSFWSVDTDERSFLRGIRLSNGFGLAWGYNRMLVTRDDFNTSESVIGNWSDVFNAEPETVRVLKGVLLPEY